MRIALIGHGKMGKELEKQAIEKGHEIALIIDETNPEALNNLGKMNVDVAIDFTTPKIVLHNIDKCFDANVPVVVGTTGWYDKLDEVKSKCEAGGHTMIYASNFSVGVNILFELNRILAKMMNNQPGYDVSIEEIHHTQKLDSPSGTAITIANGILENVERKKGWKEVEQGYKDDMQHHNGELMIHARREGNVVGTHIIKYESAIDSLELKHEAFSRAGFVQGALAAAGWIVGRKGFYSMQDMIRLDS